MAENLFDVLNQCLILGEPCHCTQTISKQLINTADCKIHQIHQLATVYLLG